MNNFFYNLGVVLRGLVIATILVPFFLIGWRYTFYLWKVMTARAKVPPVVLTEDVAFSIEGKECRLPKGLVLYPMYDGDAPECADLKSYLIHIEADSLKIRELTKGEERGATGLVYRLEKKISTDD